MINQCEARSGSYIFGRRDLTVVTPRLFCRSGGAVCGSVFLSSCASQLQLAVMSTTVSLRLGTGQLFEGITTPDTEITLAAFIDATLKDLEVQSFVFTIVRIKFMYYQVAC